MPEEIQNDPFAGMEEVKVVYKNLAWGKVGDWFKGTLTDNTRQIPNQLSPKKEMQTIYEFKAHGGSFHDIVKKQVAAEPTLVQKDEFWSFITSKPSIVSQLKNAKLGQVIGLRFAEIKEATQPGFDDAKIIKVFLGEMDPSYQGETRADTVA
jgi:hypothetical protein